MQSVEENSDDSDIKTIASDRTAAAEEFGSLLQGLLSLYEQDLHNEFIEGAQLKEENETLQRSLLLIDSLKNRITRQPNEFLETRSVYSRHSSRRSSVSCASSSVARLQALADARAQVKKLSTRALSQKKYLSAEHATPRRREFGNKRKRAIKAS